ncbi:MFS transporter [Providencia rettgeri]|uniref:MFS transporter n=3 Tax=Providencia TaxID=586 RepID=A0AAW6UHN1_PRORE|nr:MULTISPECIES: MFS transporter [Providencia]MBG5894038.1 MFS transporter [Providencia rettgeri]MDI9092923.1 MFS transporter [Providencia rettgeri]MDT2035656.1 MFS transporter [Providencia rettgeri]
MKWKYRFGAVAGNTLEYYDIAVFAAISSYLSAELERLGYNQATEMVWGIFALRFIVRPVGAYIIGRYADSVGKKSALVLTSFITGTATLCMALLPINLLGNYTPIAILILQMALSFSFAGEYPSLITYLFNNSKNNENSRLSAIINGSTAFGIIISLTVVFALEFFLEPEMMQSIGWRVPLFLGVLNIAISFWFRMKLPNNSSEKIKSVPISYMDMFFVFLLTIPGNVLFFVQHVSTAMFLEKMQMIEDRTVWALLLSILLLSFMLICGWLTDKYNILEKVYNLGVIGMVFLSIPIFLLISSQSIILTIISQLIINIYAAMILATTPFMLFKAVKGKVVTLALGFNFTAMLFGGVSPLITTYLANINIAYVGLFLTLCGALRFLIYKKPSKDFEIETKTGS